MPVGFAWNLGEYAFKSADINHSFEVTGLAELSKKLDALLMKDPKMEKKIQHIIGRALKKAEKRMESYVGSNVLSGTHRLGVAATVGHAAAEPSAWRATREPTARSSFASRTQVPASVAASVSLVGTTSRLMSIAKTSGEARREAT